MRRLLLVVMIVASGVLSGCASGGPGHLERSCPEPPGPTLAGPVLWGVVLHPSGAPLAGVEVTAHGGFATRWPLASTRTDAEGRYRFEGVEGSRILDEERDVWDLYVGVCVGSVSSGNPAAFLPWKDVRVPQDPGTVVRLDFVFDPESVPAERRG